MKEEKDDGMDDYRLKIVNQIRPRFQHVKTTSEIFMKKNRK